MRGFCLSRGLGDVYKGQPQFFPSSHALVVAEQWAINKVLHIPPGALPKHAAHLLSQAGGRDFPSVASMSTAARTRAALHTSKLLGLSLIQL